MLDALRQGMGRHHKRAFWEATIAVCALVAAPNGRVSFATRVRIDQILDGLPDLKVFDTNEFVETFDRFVDEFRVSPRKGRARALEVARHGVNSDEEAVLLVHIAFAVADTEAAADPLVLEQIEILCRELGVDANAVLASSPETADAQSDRQSAAPADAPATEPQSKTVDDIAEEQAYMNEQQPEEEEAGSMADPSADHEESAPPQEDYATSAHDEPPSAENQNDDEADLSQQLQVDGTRAVIALCGRTKTGALEALRIYEDAQLAAADCALSEKITNERFWLSPVTLFSTGQLAAMDADQQGSIHVMCLSRPDGSIEALRAFDSADQAGADLEFFRHLSDDEMWVSVVQYKAVT